MSGISSPLLVIERGYQFLSFPSLIEREELFILFGGFGRFGYPFIDVGSGGRLVFRSLLREVGFVPVLVHLLPFVGNGEDASIQYIATYPHHPH